MYYGNCKKTGRNLILNKVYKVIKNRLGQSLVASELAKGQGKSKTSSLLVKAMLASALSMCFAGHALADIVINNTDNVVIDKDNANSSANADGKFTILDTDENIIVKNSGNITTTGKGSTAMWYKLKGGSVVDITNTGNIETSTDYARGILVFGTRRENDRQIRIKNEGNISINGDRAGGIIALANDAAQWSNEGKTHTSIEVNNSGNIDITSEHPGYGGDIKTGEYPVGIIGVALNGNEGNITINNSGHISSPVHAIRAWQQGIGDINIDNAGVLTIKDSAVGWASGIYANLNVIEWNKYYIEAKGDINIRNRGTILSESKDKKDLSLIHAALSVRSNDGLGTVTGNINIDNQGQLIAKGENAKGINASMQGSADNTGTITINNNGLVDTAGNDAKAIVVESRDGDININLDSNSNIIGGGGKDGVAIDMTSAAHNRDLTKEQPALQTVNNKGVISATNDRTIVAHRSRTNGGKTIINNDGAINGFVDLSATKNINTTSDENQPNYQNVDSNGEVTFNNNGTWNIKDSTGLSSGGQVGTVINVIGTNTQNGLINNTGTIQIVDPDINSAVLKNSDVINSGVIDLGKNSADTTLTINGNYTGENGQLNIYTDVENGKSDKLIVTGDTTGKTDIDIIEIGKGDNEDGRLEDIIIVNGKDEAIWGIKEKQDSAYDYEIKRDSNGKLVIDYTNVFSNALNSPVSGSVFANQMASLGMFRHSAHDRSTAIYAPDSNVWMRTGYNREKSDLFSGRQKVEIKTSIIEMGVDVFSSDKFKVGVYGGYGHSSTDTDQKNSIRRGDGSVSGYNLGVYGHWNTQDNGAGLYVDGWAQYSWFKNKTNVHLSNVRNYSNKYDSNAGSISAEAGYGFIVHEGSNKNWLIEPHAQVGYTWTDADNFNLGNKGRVTDISGDGAQVRLGARFYGQNGKDSYGVLPFVEANWLYDSSTPEAKINGTRVKSDISKNQFEVKLGLNANFSKAVSGYAQFDGKFGSNSHSNVGAKVGLNYSF